MMVIRRTQFELRKAEESTYLRRIIIASDNIDEVIALIKASKIRKRREIN
jgi:DNA gyrase subunit A